MSEEYQQCDIFEAKRKLKETLWSNKNIILLGIGENQSIRVGTIRKDDSIPPTFMGFKIIHEIIGEIKTDIT